MSDRDNTAQSQRGHRPSVTIITFFLAANWIAAPSNVLASDACSTTAIRAAASVSVSDGSAFDIEALYHTPDHSSIRHDYSDRPDQVVAVEGPAAWITAGDETAQGSEFHKLFALGHQYHAFLTEFGEILGNVRESTAIEFDGRPHAATTGDYPYGGVVHRIQGGTPARPLGLVFDFGESGRIEAKFSDWREVDDLDLPFLATIDDGERTFDYRYTAISTKVQSPLCFSKRSLLHQLMPCRFTACIAVFLRRIALAMLNSWPS